MRRHYHMVKVRKPMIVLPRIEDCVAPHPPVGDPVGSTIACANCGAPLVKLTLAHRICEACAAPKSTPAHVPASATG